MRCRNLNFDPSPPSSVADLVCNAQGPSPVIAFDTWRMITKIRL
jgi:hypothetical protein